MVILLGRSFFLSQVLPASHPLIAEGYPPAVSVELRLLWRNAMERAHAF